MKKFILLLFIYIAVAANAQHELQDAKTLYALDPKLLKQKEEACKAFLTVSQKSDFDSLMKFVNDPWNFKVSSLNVNLLNEIKSMNCGPEETTTDGFGKAVQGVFSSLQGMNLSDLQSKIIYGLTDV